MPRVDHTSGYTTQVVERGPVSPIVGSPFGGGVGHRMGDPRTGHLVEQLWGPLQSAPLSATQWNSWAWGLA